MADFFVWGNGGQKLSQDDINDQLRYGDQLTQQAQQTPAYNWAQGASNILNSFMGGFEHGRAMKHQTENDDYNQEIIKNLYGGGENLPSFSGAGMDSPTAGDGQGAISAPARALAAQPDDVSNAGALSATPAAQRIGAALVGQDYLDRVAQVESGGSATAKNPNSSALGPYQFTNDTWQGVMQQHPDLGLTADGRTDPQQARAAAGALTSDNANFLTARGIPATNADLYVAHFLGPSGAVKALSQDASTPMASVVSKGALQANPMLANMNVGDLQNWAAQKMGQQAATQGVQPGQLGAAAATALPQAAQLGASAQIQPQQGPNIQQLMAVMNDPRANSQTKATVGALMQNQLQGDLLQRQIQLRQADPLYQAELTDRNAEAQYRQARMGAQQGTYSMLSPQQAQQMGLDPSKSYQMGPDGKISAVGGNGVNVSVNNGPTTSEFQKKSDDEAATRLGSYIQEGNTAPALIGQLQQLSDLSHNIGTGKGAQFMAQVGPYAQALGLNVKGLDQQQAFSAIVDRMAPQMRPVGSGSSSDVDVRMFMNSLPQLGNTDRGNQIIAGTMQSLQQNKLQAADIASQAQRGQISWQDAESQIRQLPNPYEQFKKAHSDLVSDGAGASGGNGARTTSTGVSWSIR